MRKIRNGNLKVGQYYMIYWGITDDCAGGNWVAFIKINSSQNRHYGVIKGNPVYNCHVIHSTKESLVNSHHDWRLATVDKDGKLNGVVYKLSKTEILTHIVAESI